MTTRQEQLLHAIVEYYVQTASPVGSKALSRKFNVSSATLRAEMAELERLGYVTHPHTSAGRIPTDRGYRLYVDLLQQKAQAVVRRREEDRIENAVDRRINSAGEPERALKVAVESLAELTYNVAVGLMGDMAYMTGLSRLFAQPEFIHSAQVHEVARMLDGLEPWIREMAPRGRMNVYIGQESPVGRGSGCAMIISRFASPYSDQSYIGVVGPVRQSYPKVMHLVEHVGKKLEEAFSV